jgi:hypothetical protein
MKVETGDTVADTLAALGLASHNPGAFDGQWIETKGEVLTSENPATGETLASVAMATEEDYERVAVTTVAAFREWQ